MASAIEPGDLGGILIIFIVFIFTIWLGKYFQNLFGVQARDPMAASAIEPCALCLDEICVLHRSQNSETVAVDQARDPIAASAIQPGALSLDEIHVLHRSQNSETVEVSLMDALNTFVCEHYPQHQTHFTKIPDSFIYEKNKEKVIHGFPTLAEKFKNIFKTDKNWLDNVSGNQAEEKVFSYLERCFSDRPSLMLHSLKFHELFKVLKETAKEKLKIEEEYKAYPELLKEEYELAEIYGVDLVMDKDKTMDYVNELFDNASSMNVEEIPNKMKTVTNPDKNPNVEINIKKMLKTHGKTHGTEMLKEDLYNFIMRYRLKLDLNRNTEFDFWVVDKEACTIFHFEVKAVKENGLENAIKNGRNQLKEGDIQFNTILKKTAKLSPEWKKVNILCLPNIANIEKLKKAVGSDKIKKNVESMNILTAKDLEEKLFPFPRKSVDNPCKEAEYLRICGTCVGSRFLTLGNQVFLAST